MTKSILVLINAKSGRTDEIGCDAVKDHLAEALRHGYEAEFLIADAPDLAKRAHGSSTDLIATAGGDGTIAAVAGALASRESPPVFIPLPYGTANLIPRDLGFPLEPEEALEAALDAPYRYIDFVDAQGCGMLHSAAFGTFADMAEGREALRDAPTFGDALGAAGEMWDHFIGTQDEPYRVTIDGESFEVESSAIFVTNNPITGGQGALPRRDRLDTGRLVAYISRSGGLFGLMQHVFEAIRGDFHNSPDFTRLSGRQVTVEALERELHYTIDGEPSSDRNEITFTMKPSSLKVPDLR